MNITVPYGSEELTFSLPRNLDADVLTPDQSIKREEISVLLTKALDNPIGSEPLENIVNSSSSVVIVIDDMTRPTPVSDILPRIIERLSKGGVRDKNIEILIALATHRPMTDKEIRAKVGNEIFAEYRISNHDFARLENLHHLGVISGIDVWINKKVASADVVVGIGSIVPHATAGFSGGAKIIIPGVAAEKTVADYHIDAAMDPENRIGRTDSPLRSKTELITKSINLAFIVNAVVVPRRGTFSIVAGDYIKAHRAGVAAAREIFGFKIPEPYDISIISSHPGDVDFWQATKALFAGEEATREGGGIILITPCPEGISPVYPDFARYIGMDRKVLIQDILAGKVEKPVAAAIASRKALIREKYSITVVSEGLSRKDVETMGFRFSSSAEEAIRTEIMRQGSVGRICAVTHGSETYAYIAPE
ncbi:MAG: nickel-dependent lactate racemase [Desulfobacteraceae bacterium]|nr:nickel-dependent lactate racemase [Desulfobacteraceae bacterium]